MCFPHTLYQLSPDLKKFTLLPLLQIYKKFLIKRNHRGTYLSTLVDGCRCHHAFNGNPKCSQTQRSVFLLGTILKVLDDTTTPFSVTFPNKSPLTFLYIANSLPLECLYIAILTMTQSLLFLTRHPCPTFQR